MTVVPADCVFGQDNVRPDLLDPGFPVYAGYWNGMYANMTALRARFPRDYLISVATNYYGSQGAMSVDVEPGTLAMDKTASFELCLRFLNDYKAASGNLPIVYVMASWSKDMELYLDAHGQSRPSYFLWSAHYIGLHLCSPAGCGYGNSVADATQYASGRNDYDVFRGYVVGKGTPPPHIPGCCQLGDSGPAVKGFQVQLNGFAKAAGYATLITDGDFGGKTYHAVRLFQAYKKLVVDGIIGPNTALALKTRPPVIVIKKPKPSPPVIPSGVPNLKLGDVNQKVAAMQYYLRNSGIYGVRGINADGAFGPQTQTALKNFQAHAKLPNDGIYGPATAKALAKVAVG